MLQQGFLPPGLILTGLLQQAGLFVLQLTKSLFRQHPFRGQGLYFLPALFLLPGARFQGSLLIERTLPLRRFQFGRQHCPYGLGVGLLVAERLEAGVQLLVEGQQSGLLFALHVFQLDLQVFLLTFQTHHLVVELHGCTHLAGEGVETYSHAEERLSLALPRRESPCIENLLVHHFPDVVRPVRLAAGKPLEQRALLRIQQRLDLFVLPVLLLELRISLLHFYLPLVREAFLQQRAFPSGRLDAGR